jgi:hypothetical protein
MASESRVILALDLAVLAEQANGEGRDGCEDADDEEDNEDLDERQAARGAARTGDGHRRDPSVRHFGIPAADIGVGILAADFAVRAERVEVVGPRPCCRGRGTYIRCPRGPSARLEARRYPPARQFFTSSGFLTSASSPWSVVG